MPCVGTCPMPQMVVGARTDSSKQQPVKAPRKVSVEEDGRSQGDRVSASQQISRRQLEQQNQAVGGGGGPFKPGPESLRGTPTCPVHLRPGSLGM